MTSSKEETARFQLLVDTAKTLGVQEAKIIPAEQVFVENRVTLKCRAGCIAYGKKLTCPPHVPTPDEFRKILAEYRYALLVKFSSKAHADKDVACSLYKYWLDPDAPADKKTEATAFWNDYFAGSKEILPVMLELEKTAFNAGFTFALAFVGGSCRLCETCNVKAGICIHPTRARIPEHAVGINMKKTAEVAGMPVRFPIEGSPEPMAILLID
jgi:predicted metal-binding protein